VNVVLKDELWTKLTWKTKNRLLGEAKTCLSRPNFVTDDDYDYVNVVVSAWR
jgi:hypothetical protein